jgi:thioredoxin reductase (NADPH)
MSSSRVAIAIVGAGPAGCSAAVQSMRLGVRPLLLDRTGEAGGLIENAYLVENYPGVEVPIDGPTYAGRLQAFLSRFELRVEQAEVTRVWSDLDGLALTADGETVRATAVILAVGTQACRLGIPGEASLEGRRLFYEVRPLLQASPFPGKVAIVGGGEAAFDYSLSIAAAGGSATILVRGERPSVRGRLLDMVRRTPDVAVELQASCLAIHDSPRGISLDLVLADGAKVANADNVLVAVGRKSRASSLAGDRPVSGHAGCDSPVPGLFVIGDARTGCLGQAGMAVGDGLWAAMKAVSYVEAQERYASTGR